MACGIALNMGIICSCVSTQTGTILKAIVVDLLNLLNRKSYRHSLIFFCVGPYVCVCARARVCVAISAFFLNGRNYRYPQL